MHHYCLLLALLFTSSNARAELFTILAPSGLNVRKAPDRHAERVTTLPFGTVVDAELNYQNDINYGRSYRHYSAVIEGKRGFWMKITYQHIEGYIFSGFGLIGEWVVPSTEINREYRLLSLGGTCNPINYDPKLNWYAMVRKNGRMELRKTQITLRLIHEFTEQDTLGGENEFWRQLPLVVNCDVRDSVFFLVGAQKSILEKEIFSAFTGKRCGYSAEAQFLYPEETWSTYYSGNAYMFRAYEKVTLMPGIQPGYKQQYQIELQMGNYPKTQTINLSPDLYLIRAHEHARYLTPQLIWIGDLNSDGLLDFIFYSHSMSEGCDVTWEHHLFLSDKSNPGKPIRKVANESTGNCTI